MRDGSPPQLEIQCLTWWPLWYNGRRNNWLCVIRVFSFCVSRLFHHLWQEHQREMSLVRSGVSGEMSLGLPWSIRKYNYRSYFYENIILAWHIILWIGGKIYIWEPHVHQTVTATRQMRIAACNSYFPFGNNGNQLTCSTLCISGI